MRYDIGKILYFPNEMLQLLFVQFTLGDISGDNGETIDSSFGVLDQGSLSPISTASDRWVRAS